MKRIFFLAILMVLVSATASLAVALPTGTIQFTTDNELTGFTFQGGDALGSATGNLQDWQSTKTFEFAYDSSQSYTFTWTILNYALGTSDPGASTGPTDPNPMAFIGQVDLGSGFALFSNLGPDSPWSILAPTTGTYEQQYGTGTWGNRPSGFSTSAYWLGATCADTMTVQLVIPAAHTPIPGAVWLLGTGLFGLVGLRRFTSV